MWFAIKSAIFFGCVFGTPVPLMPLTKLVELQQQVCSTYPSCAACLGDSDCSYSRSHGCETTQDVENDGQKDWVFVVPDCDGVVAAPTFPVAISCDTHATLDWASNTCICNDGYESNGAVTGGCTEAEPTDAPDWILGNLNSVACPSVMWEESLGMITKVVNRLQCTNYAESVGMDYDGNMSEDDLPAGCSLYDNDDVFWNEDNTGAANSNAQPICFVDTAPMPEYVLMPKINNDPKGCDESLGLDPVTDIDECLTASKYLGFVDDAVSTTTKESRPRYCYTKYSTSKGRSSVYYKDSSTGIVNDDRPEICAVNDALLFHCPKFKKTKEKEYATDYDTDNSRAENCATLNYLLGEYYAVFETAKTQPGSNREAALGALDKNWGPEIVRCYGLSVMFFGVADNTDDQPAASLLCFQDLEYAFGNTIKKTGESPDGFHAAAQSECPDGFQPTSYSTGTADADKAACKAAAISLGVWTEGEEPETIKVSSKTCSTNFYGEINYQSSNCRPKGCYVSCETNKVYIGQNGDAHYFQHQEPLFDYEAKTKRTKKDVCEAWERVHICVKEYPYII